MTQKRLLELLKQNKCDILEFQGECHDCGKKLSIQAGIDKEGAYALGGAVYEVQPPSIHETNIFLKCHDFFQKDKILRNYVPCEVYSRVVGYLRPLSQWNKGKQAEFNDRINFNITDKEENP